MGGHKDDGRQPSGQLAELVADDTQWQIDELRAEVAELRAAQRGRPTAYRLVPRELFEPGSRAYAELRAAAYRLRDARRDLNENEQRIARAHHELATGTFGDGSHVPGREQIQEHLRELRSERPPLRARVEAAEAEHRAAEEGLRPFTSVEVHGPDLTMPGILDGGGE